MDADIRSCSCGEMLIHRSGPWPSRCPACAMQARRESAVRSRACLQAARAEPGINGHVAAPPVQVPTCTRGKPITRRAASGPWPKRCAGCAVANERSKALAWYYRQTTDGLAEVRARYPSRLGRPQTAEHARKRAEATARTLAGQTRICQSCGGEFVPSVGGQRYCAGHRRLTAGRTLPRHRHIYLPGGAYERILATQDGGCAICGEKPTGNRLAVDHDHATGEVRGLLCQHCNTGLGSFRDDAGLITKAIRYLGERDKE